MTRTAWIAILLLLATNVLWAVLWPRDKETSGDLDPQTEELERTIADLRDEVEHLRHGGPLPDAVRVDDVVPVPSEPRDGEETAGGPELATGGSKPDPEAERIETERKDAAAREEEERARKEEERLRNEALAKAKSMLEKVMQVQDPALREEGLREMAEALRSSDAILVEYTLGALYGARSLEFDRSEFRQLILGHLSSPSGGVRRSALYSLRAIAPEPGDLRFALEAVNDPDPNVRRSLAKILSTYVDKQLRGDAGRAVAGLLADEDVEIRRAALHGLIGATVSPEIERRVLEMAKRPDERFQAVQVGLSTLQNKSRRVVDALFTCLEDQNHKIRARAHWGLQRGISKEQQPYVATRYADHLPKFLNPQSHREALKIIVRYGDESVTPQLERFAENELVKQDVRAMTTKVVEYLRNKSAGR